MGDSTPEPVQLIEEVLKIGLCTLLIRKEAAVGPFVAHDFLKIIKIRIFQEIPRVRRSKPHRASSTGVVLDIGKYSLWNLTLPGCTKEFDEAPREVSSERLLKARVKCVAKVFGRHSD
jgi:hypothetical protein